MKKHLLFALTFATVSCIAAPAGDTGDKDETSEQPLSTAEDEGLELMLPFPPGESRTLNQSYGAANGIGTHQRHGDGPWDDSLALDFSGDGCSSWDRPVVAAEDGTIMSLPSGVARGSTEAERYERSYGPNSVIIDHGGGCYSQYAHLRSREVEDGQRVTRGQPIGREGNLGNVNGTSCPAHPGTHLHFKVWCGQNAIVPEPLSGYHGLQGFKGKRFAHRAYHHPPGTLVQAFGDTKVHLIDGDGIRRHIADEKVWRSRRYFQNKEKEWATVVIVSRQEVDCHDPGPAIDMPARLVATTCGGTPSLTYEVDGTRWRKRIPFEPSQAGYRILLRSWGFNPDEVTKDDRWACSTPLASNDRLPLRDGTVIEQASDDDFYVISDDGTAYRLRRELMSVLYGANWPLVIQVPDGSVPSLVHRMSSGDREFSLTDMTTCPNRRHALETSLADATGGATVTETVIPDLDPGPTPAPPITPPPSPVVPGPTPTPTPAPSTLAPRTIACQRYGTTFELRITGPLTGALVGTEIANPTRIEVGSDRYGWSSANIGFPWLGDQDETGELKVYRYVYPADLGRFNLYATDATGTQGWFDLPDADQNGTTFTIQGDCIMVCTAESCAVSLK